MHKLVLASNMLSSAQICYNFHVLFQLLTLGQWILIIKLFLFSKQNYVTIKKLKNKQKWVGGLCNNLIKMVLIIDETACVTAGFDSFSRQVLEQR